MCSVQREKWYKGCKVNLWNIKLISVQYLMRTMSEHYLCKHKSVVVTFFMWKEAELIAEYKGEISDCKVSVWRQTCQTPSLWYLSVEALPWIQENRICAQVQKKQLLCDRIKYNYYFPRKWFFQEPYILHVFAGFLKWVNLIWQKELIHTSSINTKVCSAEPVAQVMPNT